MKHRSREPIWSISMSLVLGVMKCQVCLHRNKLALKGRTFHRTQWETRWREDTVLRCLMNTEVGILPALLTTVLTMSLINLVQRRSLWPGPLSTSKKLLWKTWEQACQFSIQTMVLAQTLVLTWDKIELKILQLICKEQVESSTDSGRMIVTSTWILAWAIGVTLLIFPSWGPIQGLFTIATWRNLCRWTSLKSLRVALRMFQRSGLPMRKQNNRFGKGAIQLFWERLLAIFLETLTYNFLLVREHLSV
jgi:hypothetical protein